MKCWRIVDGTSFNISAGVQDEVVSTGSSCQMGTHSHLKGLVSQLAQVPPEPLQFLVAQVQTIVLTVSLACGSKTGSVLHRS